MIGGNQHDFFIYFGDAGLFNLAGDTGWKKFFVCFFVHLVNGMISAFTGNNTICIIVGYGDYRQVMPKAVYNNGFAESFYIILRIIFVLLIGNNFFFGYKFEIVVGVCLHLFQSVSAFGI